MFRPMTNMPSAPWKKLHLDFKGPLPGGKYLLVVIDRYSRYPEVEIITSTNAKNVIRKLNKIFASHGIPEVLITDNGPPFKSTEFRDYMKELGTSHEFSTPYWPQGNAEAERFMRTLSKVLTIANMTNDNLDNALYKFLFHYRSTPHCTTKVPPAELIYNRKIRGKIPEENNSRVDKHHIAIENDKKSRRYNKYYADKRRNTQRNEIKVGDSVLLKQRVKHKLMSKFNPVPCTIVNITGPEVTVITQQGEHICRNKSYIKKIPKLGHETDDDEDDYEKQCAFDGLASEVAPDDVSGHLIENESESEATTADATSDTIENENEQFDTGVKRSSRTTRMPEKYGMPVSSEIIEDNL